MNLRNVILAAAIATVWLPGQAAHAFLNKQVGAWDVDCSNGLTCNMSVSDWSAKGVQYVGFQRRGAPHAAVDLRLRTDRDFSPDEDLGVTFRFTVDGKVLLTLAAKDLTQEEHSDVYFYSEQTKVLALLDALENGKTADVTITGKAGSRTLPIKLDGVNGAMLYVDDVQGRLGRIDALRAKGDKKISRWAMAKDIKSLEDMPEIIRKEFTDSGGACSDLLPETIRQFDGFDVTLGPVQLIAVPCATGGAYNQPYALYTMSEVAERISFPDVFDGRPTTMSTAMNIDFDPVSRTITAFFRGRGLGDCGEYHKWQLDKMANRLELLEIRAKPDCDEGGNDPTKFPLVWRAEK